MIRTVDEGDLDVDHGIAGDHTVLHGLHDPLLYRHNLFLGARAANRLIHKLKAFSRLLRLKFDHRMPVLAATAGLTYIFSFRRYLLADRFPVRPLGLAPL